MTGKDATQMRLKAVIFDWAGTIVDFGSRAPMGAFVTAFQHFGVDISIAEARIPMGLPKRAHVQALLNLPRIKDAWNRERGDPTDEDVDAIYDVFVPLNEASVADHATLVPGALEAVATIRARGLKIGTTTGYTRSIMARLAPLAADQGYRPDNIVCADDLPVGRPTPMMMYRCFLDLGVWPGAACVKVDDTVPGISEGIAAGTWTIGVVVSGNGIGLSEIEWSALPVTEQNRLRARSAAELTAAGAHAVVDTVADVPRCLDAFAGRLTAGVRP